MFGETEHEVVVFIDFSFVAVPASATTAGVCACACVRACVHACMHALMYVCVQMNLIIWKISWLWDVLVIFQWFVRGFLSALSSMKLSYPSFQLLFLSVIILTSANLKIVQVQIQ